MTDPGSPAIRNVNIAKGNAQVGVQAGTVHRVQMAGGTGSVAGASAAEQLAALRQAITDAYRSGRIDDDTLAEAEKELATTEAALPEVNTSGPGRVIRSLRRLNGTMDGVGGVATLVAAIIQVVGGAH